MGSRNSFLRVGVAQIENHFGYHLNRTAILRAISYFSKTDADLILFPECAVSGYNTGLLQIDALEGERTVNWARDAAKTHRVTLALPTPSSVGDGTFYNSVFIIDKTGEITHRFHKSRLQRGEEKLFIPAPRQSRRFEVKGYRLGILICVETASEPWKHLDRSEPVDAILWPGFYATREGETWADARSADDLQVKANALEWNTPLIQATCATSPEAHFWSDRVFGGSLVLDSSGREVHCARRAQEDCYTVMLGDNGSVSVRPQASDRSA